MIEYLLKDISSKIGSGATPTGGKESYKGGRFSLIRSQNVLDMAFSYEGLAHINDEQAHKLDGVEVCSRDILFNITGDSICRCCIVPDDVLPARVNQHVAIIRTPNVDSRYVMYYLQYLKPYLMKICGGGSSRNALTKENLEALTIPIPNNAEKIANVLSTIDLKIKNNNTIISELESMSKDIYDYWFVQFDFPDENGRPYKSSGGRMVWNEDLNREIPDGWKPTRFGDLVTVKRGISYSASNLVDAGLPMINLNSFTPSATYKTSGIKYYKGEVKDGGQVNAYDLLMCTTQQTDIDGKTDIIGKTMLIPDLFDSQMVYSMDLVRIQTDELLKTVIVSETKTPWYNKYITGFATGTSILHLKLDGFLSYQIPLPKGTAILKHFNSLYMELERRKSIAMKENEELTSLRDWLLPMLMNGQVKVGGVA